jgi:hypothetical protein
MPVYLQWLFKRAKIICVECLSSDLLYGNLYYKCNYVVVVVVVVVVVDDDDDDDVVVT